MIFLTFESGLKLVYKPKDLGVEVVFNRFLDWCNQHTQSFRFQGGSGIRRGTATVGWNMLNICLVRMKPLRQRFYQRSGILLCVIYALRGTDCHYENLIANGEHLVLIDMETLLHHEAKPH